MERAHVNLFEWVATLSAEAQFRLSLTLARFRRRVRSVRRTVSELGYRATMRHWRLQEALREKEKDLAKLLDDSRDPAIVTDDCHRVLAANRAALALFGVSRANIREFAIDAFVPACQVGYFEHTGPPYIKNSERFGECLIRALDGRSKVVEYSFQANFVLGRHLSQFHDVRPQKQADWP